MSVSCGAVFAVSRSPSATLGILAQTRAKGLVATATLAQVMSSDVVVLVLMAVMLTIARPMIDPSLSLSTDSFAELGHAILGSVAIGTTLGLLLIVYLKLVGRALVVLLVALGFVASEILDYLGFEPLLAFLVAGFVVQNLSVEGEKFLAAIDEMGSIVYVVFFAPPAPTWTFRWCGSCGRWPSRSARSASSAPGWRRGSRRDWRTIHRRCGRGDGRASSLRPGSRSACRRWSSARFPPSARRSARWRWPRWR